MIREGNITMITGKDGNPQSKYIKPCPFCGSKPEIKIVTKGKNVYIDIINITISCSGCGANITSISDPSEYMNDKIATVNKWNRRVVTDVCKDFNC